jgi:hypothetical protein
MPRRLQLEPTLIAHKFVSTKERLQRAEHTVSDRRESQNPCIVMRESEKHCNYVTVGSDVWKGLGSTRPQLERTSRRFTATSWTRGVVASWPVCLAINAPPFEGGRYNSPTGVLDPLRRTYSRFHTDRGAMLANAGGI